ncbi:MAG: hypothetical protein K0Q97_756 [Bacillota bacterium]|jgi:hypothetical protein|nr:hypothetical protein [Bacillota bacterium]
MAWITSNYLSLHSVEASGGTNISLEFINEIIIYLVELCCTIYIPMNNSFKQEI